MLVRSRIAICWFLLLACTQSEPSAAKTPSTVVIPAKPPTEEQVQPATTNAATKGDAHDILASETIGGLRLKMSAADIVAKLGKPSATDEPSGPVDGEYMQTWTYADAGMKLIVVSSKPDGGQTLHSITIVATDETTTKLQTSRGIMLGSSWADVHAAYADALYLDDDEGEYAEHAALQAGSLYGGLEFGFENERVESIELAPAPDC